MLLDCERENHNVIKVEKQGLALLVTKKPLHQPLESAGGATEAKGHPVPLEKPKRCAECSLGSISLGDWDLVVTTGEVEGGKPSSTRQCIQGFFNARKGKGILPHLAVELPIIYAYAQATIRFSDKHNGGCIGTATFAYHLCCQQLIAALLNLKNMKFNMADL